MDTVHTEIANLLDPNKSAVLFLITTMNVAPLKPAMNRMATIRVLVAKLEELHYRK